MRTMQHMEGRDVLATARGTRLGGTIQDDYRPAYESEERQLGLRY